MEYIFNPLRHGEGGGGAVRLPPCGFLPSTQKIFRQPIHENSWLFQNSYCGCHYEKKIPLTHKGNGGGESPVVFCPLLKNLQATHTWKFLTFPNFWLRIPLWFFFQNILFTPSDTQDKNIQFNQKNLLTNPSWNNF